MRQLSPLLPNNFSTKPLLTKLLLNPWLVRRFHLSPPFSMRSLQYPVEKTHGVTSSNGFIFPSWSPFRTSTPKRTYWSCLHKKVPSNLHCSFFRNRFETVPKLRLPNRRALQNISLVHFITPWIHSEHINSLFITLLPVLPRKGYERRWKYPFWWVSNLRDLFQGIKNKTRRTI